MYAVEANNLSKIYRMYQRPLDRLKEALLRKPFRETFESLRNISFAVPYGQPLGIIGDNGAGKSTLLKICAGTLTPTTGEVITRGRVSALLELGTGFHSEFTGRQNIYLNAALQGLTGSEIKEMEPKIIDFAELGQFIDMPLKTYSSGMIVRLAFSIATSVDPDILIVDEALSVGDQYFQKKCVDRIMEFREKRKTILFCSHSMYMVNQLCQKTIWLDNGSVRAEGPAHHITAAYETYTREKGGGHKRNQGSGPAKADEKNPVVIRSITMNDHNGPITLAYKESLDIILEFESVDECSFWVGLEIQRNDGLVCHGVKMSRDKSQPLRMKGVGKVRLRYRSLPLLHGDYSVMGAILDESGLHVYDKKQSETFSIVPPDEWGEESGILDLDHEWEIL